MKTYTGDEMVKKVWKSLLIIVVLAIIGGGIMGLLAKKRQSTSYTASTSVMISHNLNENRNLRSDSQNNMVNADLGMMPTYETVAKNMAVSDEAHKLLPKKVRKHYSKEDINSDVDAKSKPQSLVLDIHATTGSQKDSVALANASAKAFKKVLPRVQAGAGNIRIVNKATKDTVTSKTSPSVKKYAAVGIALGGLVGLIISFAAITSKNFISRRK